MYFLVPSLGEVWQTKLVKFKWSNCQIVLLKFSNVKRVRAYFYHCRIKMIIIDKLQCIVVVVDSTVTVTSQNFSDTLNVTLLSHSIQLCHVIMTVELNLKPNTPKHFSWTSFIGGLKSSLPGAEGQCNVLPLIAPIGHQNGKLISLKR
jgi:hypothetical protein